MDNTALTVESISIILGSIIDKSKDVIYVSHPITSGKRVMDWFCYSESTKTMVINDLELTFWCTKSFRENVIQPNIAAARDTVEKYRDYESVQVIFPGQIQVISQFSNADYYQMWERIINEHVTQMIFINDWQYSKGCIYEFLVGIKKGILMETEMGVKLTLEYGIELIKDAMLSMAHLGFTSNFIKEQLVELTAIALRQKGE